MGGSLSRREFIVGSSVAGASLLLPSFAHAQGSDKIRVGLIGAGGRGCGAAANCVESSPGVEIYAVGDLFPDRLAGANNTLSSQLKEKYTANIDRQFSGWDAYKKVLAQPIDMVILATPPTFRPVHLAAAIEAGKHVFMEKPVATDAPGVRSIIESSDKAAAKGLAIVCGTQRRHDLAYNEAMKRIHDGQIGEITSMNCYWNQGGLWSVQRTPQMSDMEWQLRNWLYFTWISGDIIVEQHIHNIDVCNWAMNQHPVKAVSLAGRQVRTAPVYGMVFDHFATEFEYANGVKMVSMCRQIDGTDGAVWENIVGNKGRSDGNTWINGANEWKWSGDRPNPYMLEHRDLIASIRAGKPLNEGRRIAETTMTAIMGRMAGYTGKVITWDQAMNSQEKLGPDKYEFGQVPIAPVAIPGTTPFK